MKSVLIYFSVLIIGLLFVSSAPSSTIPQIETIALDVEYAEQRLADIKSKVSKFRVLLPNRGGRGYSAEVGALKASTSEKNLKDSDIRFLGSVQPTEPDSNTLIQAKSFKEKCRVIEALIMKDTKNE